MPRLFRSGDADALDLLLNFNREGDVQVKKDVIVVSGEPPTSTLVWRPCALVHEFEVSAGLARLRTAKSLVDFALADTQSRRFAVRDAIFIVAADNAPMLRFVRSLPGAREDNGRLFYLEV